MGTDKMTLGVFITNVKFQVLWPLVARLLSRIRSYKSKETREGKQCLVLFTRKSCCYPIYKKIVNSMVNSSVDPSYEDIFKLRSHHNEIQSNDSCHIFSHSYPMQHSYDSSNCKFEFLENSKVATETRISQVRCGLMSASYFKSLLGFSVLV